MNNKYRVLLDTAAITAAAAVIIKLCLVFLWPVAVSLAVVLIMEPAVGVFVNLGFLRRHAAIITFVITFILLCISFYNLSDIIIRSVVSSQKDIISIFEVINKRLEIFNMPYIDYNRIFSSAVSMISEYRNKICSVALTTLQGIGDILFILIASLLISADADKADKAAEKLLPATIYNTVISMIKKSGRIIKVEFILMVVTAAETCAGLAILGINKALIIGIYCGILDMLPILGPMVIFLPWTVYEIIAEDYYTAIGLAVLYILTGVSRKVLEIKFLGSALRISPAAVIISLYIGIIIYGIWGIFIGPMLYVFARELSHELTKGGYRFLI